MLRSSGVKLSALDEQKQSKFEDSTAQTVWGPYIDLLDVKALIKLVNEIGDSLNSEVVRSNEIRAFMELSGEGKIL